MSFEVHAARRAEVLARIGERGALVLAATPELRVGRDAELRYTVDPDLFYLTGYAEPEAVMVLMAGETPLTMFVRPRDAERELWTGVRGGVEAARERVGADAAYPIAELRERLPKLLAQADAVYARPGTGRADLDTLLLAALVAGRRLRPRKGRGPQAIVEAGAVLDEMRLIKDAGEIERLRGAARITAESFREAAAAVRPGAGEWLVEAAVEHGFRRRGAWGPAFPTIVAAAGNATVLHYIENARTMNAGELVLVDAGARWEMYCADISRTFPVSGRFEAAQRDLYDAVLSARDAAIAAVRPGAPADAPHDAAHTVLVDALVSLALIEGSVDDARADEDRTKPLLPHRVSHWLGLDVHDPGDYVDRNGEPRLLEPGMVLTIEPGVYIPAGHGRGPRELDATGIRIEDDVLVTGDGADVLTAALPAAAEEIEAIVGN